MLQSTWRAHGEHAWAPLPARDVLDGTLVRRSQGRRRRGHCTGVGRTGNAPGVIAFFAHGLSSMESWAHMDVVPAVLWTALRISHRQLLAPTWISLLRQLLRKLGQAVAPERRMAHGISHYQSATAVNSTDNWKPYSLTSTKSWSTSKRSSTHHQEAIGTMDGFPRERSLPRWSPPRGSTRQSKSVKQCSA